ncbi:MAG: Sulfate transporter, inner rane subunit CysT [Verrucomicrobiales bacterium]|nr:Sulfate transporter, inner rane subunit CysT [Verrucomicrobiales bacterium]
MSSRKFNALPGFGLTLGFSVLYLSIIVLIPVSALVLKSLQITWPEFWAVIKSKQAISAFKLTFGASLIAGALNCIFGSLLAWVLVRYRFPGKKLIDGLVDFPFALPTAVAGLSLAALFSKDGWLGSFLIPMGVQVTYTRIGIVIALTFVGMPFAVRTLQPVLENLDASLEEVAATMGAGRFRTFCQVVGPSLLPAILTGFALSFARAVGEYGSVVFISSNLPNKTQIAPSLIFAFLETNDYTKATAVAAVLLVISFVILGIINYLENWSSRFNQ